MTPMPTLPELVAEMRSLASNPPDYLTNASLLESIDTFAEQLAALATRQGEAKPPGWEFRWHDGFVSDLLLISHPDHGGVGVTENPTEPRTIPEAMLFLLARDFMRPAPVASEWISVKDRLPDRDAGGNVLVFGRNSVGIDAIHVASLHRYVNDAALNDEPPIYTHWMPLPQPPAMQGKDS